VLQEGAKADRKSASKSDRDRNRDFKEQSLEKVTET